MTEVLEAFLQVEGNRVVDRGPDAALMEICCEFVPPRRQYVENVVDGLIPFGDLLEAELGDLREPLEIARRDPGPGGYGLLDPRKLHP